MSNLNHPIPKVILSSLFLSFSNKCKLPPHVFSITGKGVAFHPIIQAKNRRIIWTLPYINLYTIPMDSIQYFFKQSFFYCEEKPLILLHFKLLSFLVRSSLNTSLSASKLSSLQFIFHLRVSDFFFHHRLNLDTCLLETIHCNWNEH